MPLIPAQPEEAAKTAEKKQGGWWEKSQISIANAGDIHVEAGLQPGHLSVWLVGLPYQAERP